MPLCYDADLIQGLMEISVIKLIKMDRNPDPPILRLVLITNFLKKAGVPKNLLYGVNRRDEDGPRGTKYRKLNEGTVEGTGGPDDSLPKIDVSRLINHIAQGLPLIP